jgi:glycosyltransferase involved in cell wall biosynthesis
MAGRLRPWKGPETFLQMAAQLHDADPPPYFLLIGGQPFGDEDGYERHLHRLAAQSPVAERLCFTGHLADIRPALAALDIFVHPGQPEPFGLVNIEAMAMARPVVAFAHGALPEIVVHGQTGLLVPPDDVAALAGGVRTLLADPERRQAMGCTGRDRVKTHFTIQRVAREVDAALQKVLDP